MDDKLLKITNGPDKDALFHAFYHSCDHIKGGFERPPEAYVKFEFEKIGEQKALISSLSYEDGSGISFLVGFRFDDDNPFRSYINNSGEGCWASYNGYYHAGPKTGFIRIKDDID